MAQCTARSKQSGEQCKKDAIPGRAVCHIHGGKSLAGIASPSYRTGKYSKVLPARMAERYQEALDDPRLLELRDDLSLLDARLADVLSRVDTGESGALWQQLMQRRSEVIAAGRAGDSVAKAAAMNALLDLVSQGHADYRAWAEVGAVLEQRRKLVESERKRLIEMQQTLTVEKAMLLVGAIGGIIKAHIHDRAVLSAISRDIQSLTDREA